MSWRAKQWCQQAQMDGLASAKTAPVRPQRTSTLRARVASRFQGSVSASDDGYQVPAPPEPAGQDPCVQVVHPRQVRWSAGPAAAGLACRRALSARVLAATAPTGTIIRGTTRSPTHPLPPTPARFEEKAEVEREVHRIVTTRPASYTNFIEASCAASRPPSAAACACAPLSRRGVRSTACRGRFSYLSAPRPSSGPTSSCTAATLDCTSRSGWTRTRTALRASRCAAAPPVISPGGPPIAATHYRLPPLPHVPRQAIHLFVETLDAYFKNVVELDIVFNFNKVREAALTVLPSSSLAHHPSAHLPCWPGVRHRGRDRHGRGDHRVEQAGDDGVDRGRGPDGEGQLVSPTAAGTACDGCSWERRVGRLCPAAP